MGPFNKNRLRRNLENATSFYIHGPDFLISLRQRNSNSHWNVGENYSILASSASMDLHHFPRISTFYKMYDEGAAVECLMIREGRRNVSQKVGVCGVGEPSGPSLFQRCGSEHRFICEFQRTVFT